MTASDSTTRLKPSERTQKILWARAAGRCSKCQAKLTLDTASDGVATLGKMAHIVGAEPDGPRGVSILSPEERRKYSNLILLCGLCHDEVDEDEVRYPVEVLHQIKAEHELWVEHSLSSKSANYDDELYAHIVDMLTVSLQLDNWDDIARRAVKNVLSRSISDSRDALLRIQHGTVWPGVHLGLERNISQLVESAVRYVDHFRSNAIDSGRAYLQEDRSWDELSDSMSYDFALRKSQYWSQKSYLLFLLYTHDLNEYACTVRSTISPAYFRLEGKFLVKDKSNPSEFSLLSRDDVELRLGTLEQQHAR